MGGGKKLPNFKYFTCRSNGRNSKFGGFGILKFKNNIMKNINFMDSLNGSNNRIVEVQKVLEQIKIGFWKKQIKDIQYQ